ncbi:MAG: hypothetical protein JRC77_01365 [Deltaproteobacteria bacterium]|nr:hypothetical protein [Deltaproteobacteria bacterium]
MRTGLGLELELEMELEGQIKRTPIKRALLAMSGCLAFVLSAVLSTVLSTGPGIALAEEGEVASQICVAPLASGFEVPPVAVEGTEENEAADESLVLVEGSVDNAAVALPDRHVTGEVNIQGEVLAARQRAVSLGPLSTSDRSLIKIREDGKIVQSFLYQRARGQSGDYCLVYRMGLETWAILPLQKVGDWCSCNHRSYVAPAIPEEEQEGE